MFDGTGDRRSGYDLTIGDITLCQRLLEIHAYGKAVAVSPREMAIAWFAARSSPFMGVENLVRHLEPLAPEHRRKRRPIEVSQLIAKLEKLGAGAMVPVFDETRRGWWVRFIPVAEAIGSELESGLRIGPARLSNTYGLAVGNGQIVAFTDPQWRLLRAHCDQAGRPLSRQDMSFAAFGVPNVDNFLIRGALFGIIEQLALVGVDRAFHSSAEGWSINAGLVRPGSSSTPHPTVLPGSWRHAALAGATIDSMVARLPPAAAPYVVSRLQGRSTTETSSETGRAEKTVRAARQLAIRTLIEAGETPARIGQLRDAMRQASHSSLIRGRSADVLRNERVDHELRRLLSVLPPGQIEAIVARLGGSQLDKVAGQLGISASALSVQTREGFNQLRAVHGPIDRLEELRQAVLVGRKPSLKAKREETLERPSLAGPMAELLDRAELTVYELAVVVRLLEGESVDEVSRSLGVLSSTVHQYALTAAARVNRVDKDSAEARRLQNIVSRRAQLSAADRSRRQTEQASQLIEESNLDDETKSHLGSLPLNVVRVFIERLQGTTAGAAAAELDLSLTSITDLTRSGFHLLAAAGVPPEVRQAMRQRMHLTALERRLTKENRPLVDQLFADLLPEVKAAVRSARRHLPPRFSAAELESYALTGLYEAAARWVTGSTPARARGVPVKTYARASMRGAILGGITGENGSEKKMLQRLVAAKSIPRDEVPGALSEDAFGEQTLHAVRRAIRLDKPLADDGTGVTGYDIAVTDEASRSADATQEGRHRRAMVEALLASLSETEAEVLRQSILEERSPEDVAEAVGLTPTEVMDVTERALADLRDRGPDLLARMRLRAQQAEEAVETGTAGPRSVEANFGR